MVAVADSKINTFFYPNVVFIDPDLLALTTAVKEVAELGRLPQVVHYSESQITIRRRDGGVVTAASSPYPTILLDFC